MEEYCLLYGKNGELILISGALCWSVQVVAGINPALIAGRVYLLFKGESKPGSRAILRGDGAGGLIPSHDAEVGYELTGLQLILL